VNSVLCFDTTLAFIASSIFDNTGIGVVYLNLLQEVVMQSIQVLFGYNE